MKIMHDSCCHDSHHHAPDVVQNVLKSKMLLTAAKQSYKEDPEDLEHDGLKAELVLDTKNVDAHVDFDAKIVIASFKGTNVSSWNDLIADARLVFSDLKNATRFQSDHGYFKRILQRHPHPMFKCFMASHSLGGATSTELQRMYPFVAFSKTFNPAVQPRIDFKTEEDMNMLRVYNELDPLHKIFGGRRFKKKRVVECKSKITNFLDYFKPSFLKAHNIQSFS